MRNVLIVTLMLGLTGCNQSEENMTDDEVLLASCMDDSHMSKQSLELFGPLNIEWCQCQLDVINKTMSPETLQEVVGQIRAGESPHFMHAASITSREADDEASAAMKAWVPTCKPLR